MNKRAILPSWLLLLLVGLAVFVVVLIIFNKSFFPGLEKLSDMIRLRI